MKKLRAHTALFSLLTLLLSVSLVFPANAMMLWCSMDMDMTRHHSEMSMGNDATTHIEKNDSSQMKMEHCESIANMHAEASTDQDEAHCILAVDCNCIIKQQETLPATSIITSPSLHLSEGNLSLRSIEFHSQLRQETFPPPLWNSSSYSPPILFLANEAFLI